MISVWIFALFVCGVTGIVCPPEFCDRVQCAGVEACEDGYIKERGTICGCCPACIKYLDDGDLCWNHFLLGTPITGECRPGSHCNKLTHTCQKSGSGFGSARSSCADERQKALDRIKNNPGIVGVPVPQCDADGTFTAKQCREAYCHCVTKSGKHIPDYSFHVSNSADSECKCAREQYDIRSSHLIGKMIGCDDNGNYKSSQCTGSVCYCVDHKTGKQLGQGVHISEIRILNC